METRFPLKVSGYARTSLSATVAITSVKIEVVFENEVFLYFSRVRPYEIDSF